LNPKKVFVILFFITVFMAFSVPQAQAMDRYYGLSSTAGFGCSLDTQTFYWLITTDKGYSFDVWLKFDYTEKGAQEVINSKKKAQLPTDGWQNLKYALNHIVFSFDGKRSIFKVLSTTYYTQDSILSNSTFNDNDWKDVIPGSMSETWLSQILWYQDHNKIPPKQ